jgi:hypothetical protein
MAKERRWQLSPVVSNPRFTSDFAALVKHQSVDSCCENGEYSVVRWPGNHFRRADDDDDDDEYRTRTFARP